ncbi:MAG TPA: Sir2 family NAD-dependent protein deacetylase [Pseudolysinimonas sp.]|nr:Sir2 family NAD-dependent protein deacetylase [Pseudolysinimonas sp.]
MTTLPDLDPAVLTLIDQAERLLAGRRVAVLTGAGVSTDSGIPDYRGEGAPVRNPMTFQTFLADTRARQRYWAGSHLGWRYFASAGPNAGHVALAELELAGVVNGVITQNVDGLHLQAGSQHVVDVHGSMNRVFCLSCGQQFAREDIAARMTRENPWLAEPETVKLNPDGDVDIDAVGDMIVPECTVCEGILKPDVVFFGELVPTTKFAAGASLIRSADALMVVGSSLVVNSGVRLLEQAVRRRMPIVIVNRGETKGDSRATLKIDAGTSEVLGALKERLAS